MGTIKTTNIETITGSGTLTFGQSGETINIPSGCTINNNGTQTGFGEITTADMWRTSAHQTIPSSTTTVVSSWTQMSYLGSAMSVSSGVFTFPSTGIWLVHYNMYAYKTSDMDYITTYLQTTTDNSSYDNTAFGDNRFESYYQTSNQQIIFDVTNTSTHKVRFAHYAPSDFSLRGGSEALTYAQFIRLGDT